MNLFRRLFGPSQNEVWKQLCYEIGADFIKGGLFKASKVEARIRNWTVTLDTYTVSTGKSSVTYTRMRAPFINNDGFRFKVYRKHMLSGVGKLLGMQDVEVGGPKFDSLEPLFGLRSYVDPQMIESGDPEFDRDFIIKSNNEQKVKVLFKQLKIRELLQSQPSINLEVKGAGGWPKSGKNRGFDELYFQVTGVIKDLRRLKQLFELYKELLNGLHSQGTASEELIPR
jgi:hypothetical protein